MKKTMNVILSLVLMVCMIFGLTAPAYVARADTMLNCPNHCHRKIMMKQMNFSS